MFKDFRPLMPARDKSCLQLRPGMKVTCPNCGRVMLECTKQPIAGDSRWKDWFKPVHFSNQEGAMPWCPFDGWLFYDPMNGVHTKEIGWTF